MPTTDVLANDPPAKALAAALARERRSSAACDNSAPPRLPIGSSESVRSQASMLMGGASPKRDSLYASSGQNSPASTSKPPVGRSPVRRMQTTGSVDSLHPRKRSGAGDPGVGDQFMDEINELRQKNMSLLEENMEMRGKMLRQQNEREAQPSPQPHQQRLHQSPSPQRQQQQQVLGHHTMVQAGTGVQRMVSSGTAACSPAVAHRVVAQSPTLGHRPVAVTLQSSNASTSHVRIVHR